MGEAGFGTGKIAFGLSDLAMAFWTGLDWIREMESEAIGIAEVYCS